MIKKQTFLHGVALATVVMAASQVRAEEMAGMDSASIPQASEIVVIGEIAYRNRSEGVTPTLSYGTDYFQRFEPLTAGDALKRVPSVTFLSDVIESDGARLRGLEPGYTQILINGEKVPGSNADRSFFMDRIPAELIERVEIVRSSSARRTGDAVAGTLNIVLRDGYQLDGGYLIASSQGDATYPVWEVCGDTYSYKGRFAVEGGSIDAVTGTDGLDAWSGPIGSFTEGAVAMHDTADGSGPQQNYKIIEWGAVRKALSLP